MLTDTERSTLVDSANGLIVKQIADKRGVCNRAIENQLMAARRKLGARTTANAVARAMKMKLIMFSEIAMIALLCLNPVMHDFWDDASGDYDRTSGKTKITRVRRGRRD